MEKYINKMLEYIDYPNGFYIEAGANNGVDQSYTFELEKKGWHGVLIEPSINAFNECLKNRNEDNYFYNCALVDSEDISTVEGDFNGSMLSSIGGVRLDSDLRIKANARTLNSIMDEIKPGKIDLLVLDVEGHELEVLNGFDMIRYKPTYIIIEIYNHIADKIWEVMVYCNYKLIANLTGFKKSTHPQWDGKCNDYLFTL